MTASVAQFQLAPKPIFGERQRQRWRVAAGLRFLSVVNAPNAEAKWIGRERLRRALADRLASGALRPTDSYNILRTEPTGELRHITMFASGAGRNWAGDFPPEVSSLLTIELDLRSASAGSTVATTVLSAAKALSPRAARTAEDKVQKLQTATSRPRLAELSIFHWAMAPEFLSANMAFLADRFIEFFQDALGLVRAARDRGAILEPELERYKNNLLGRFQANTEPGLIVVYLLLLSEIWRAALPDWPFGIVNWVCGDTDCSHALCGSHRQMVLQATAPLSVLAGALTLQRINAYTLKHTVTAGGVLQSILSHAKGPEWLFGAGTALQKSAEDLRRTLNSTAEPERFYTIQHEIFAFAAAAEVAFDALSNAHPRSARQFNTAKNASDEIKARAQNAVQIDFENALDCQPLLECRARFLAAQTESPIAAEDLLAKWLHDETMFPPSWASFLSGHTNELPASALPGKGSTAEQLSERLTAFFRSSKPR